MAISANFAQDGQSDSSVQELNDNFILASDYITPAFPDIP
jgi:hypothetical protein